MKNWTLTEISCIMEIPFRTALSWTNGHPLRIRPSVKIKGQPKKRYTFAEFGEFPLAKSLFSQNVPSKLIQQTLEFFREYELLERIFPNDLDPAVLDSPRRKELLATTFLLTWFPGPKPVTLADGRVMKPMEAMVIHFPAEDVQRFSEHCRMLAEGGWPVHLIHLSRIASELHQRLYCYMNSVDYADIAAKNRTSSAESMQKAFAAASDARALEELGKK